MPERNAAGEVVSVLTITRDVTALRAREHDAQQRALLAEQLVGIVSHDLRNPLNTVRLATHLLRASALDANLTRVVTRITSAAERADRLVGDLLDFTQARSAALCASNERAWICTPSSESVWKSCVWHTRDACWSIVRWAAALAW